MVHPTFITSIWLRKQKKTLLLNILLSIASLISSHALLLSQPTTYHYSYEFPGEVSYYTQHVTSFDGGALQYIKTQDFISFVKTDSIGQVEWVLRLDSIYASTGNIVQLPDSTFFTCLLDWISGEYKLLSISNQGSIVYLRSYRVPPGYNVNATDPVVQAMSNGEAVIACNAFNFQTSMYNWHVFYVDLSGGLLWSNIYNTNGQKSYSCDVDTCMNGDIVILGSDRLNSVTHAPMLLRISQSGTFVWNKSYVTPTIDMYPKTLRIFRNNILIAGETVNTSNNIETMCVLTDSSGAVQWSFCYSHDSLWLSPQESAISNHETFLIGATEVRGTTIIEVDTTGLLISSHFHENLSISSIDNSVSALRLSGFSTNNYQPHMLTATFAGVPCNDSTVSLNKTPKTLVDTIWGSAMPLALQETFTFQDTAFAWPNIIDFCLVDAIQDVNSKASNVFPNPASATVTIQSKSSITKIEVIDAVGTILLSQRVNTYHTEMDVSWLPSGCYVIRTVHETHIESHRLVIE